MRNDTIFSSSGSRVKRVKDFGEFPLIEQLTGGIRNIKSVVKGIGDDTAVVQSSHNHYTLLTTDMLIEGVHFTQAMPPRLIGWKALAASISDIAAMGGVPRHALISVGIHPSRAASTIKGVYAGIKRCAKLFGVQVVGGDTVKSKALILNVALTGEVDPVRLVTRDGAKKGDVIFVTGPLGNSFSSRHHLKFTPRLKESQYVVKQYKPTAMIDISDGLSGDLGHILQSSQVGAVLESKNIPLRKGADLDAALGDGEDFELLFTLAPNNARRLLANKRSPFAFHDIGRVVDASQGLKIKDDKGKARRIPSRGFTHF